MKRYRNLDEAMCRELELLDKKYGSEGKQMDPQDVERADKLYHALKSAETYYAMKEAGDEWEDEESGARRGGRGYGMRRSYGMGMPMSRGMGRDYSGGYPEWPPHYPW